MRNELEEFGNIKIKDIMIKEPLSITPEEKISKTELLMLKKNIGGLPVIKDGKLIGIITQRDIRLARFAVSLESPNTLVRDLYTPEPYILKENDTIKDATNKMFKYDVERLPVINQNNELVGLVLERQILEQLYKALNK
ncbi:MAG: putative signal transduction protein [Promethearchaeota archaeon]|nr:MAG: putative signal transduction protein [Candidatus Lokiarchaeota archaeon]